MCPPLLFVSLVSMSDQSDRQCPRHCCSCPSFLCQTKVTDDVPPLLFVSLVSMSDQSDRRCVRYCCSCPSFLCQTVVTGEFEELLEVEKLRARLLNSQDGQDAFQTEREEVTSQDVLSRIENVILGIVLSLSRGEAPVLAFHSRSHWLNVRFHSNIGLHMGSDTAVNIVRSDCPSSIGRFASTLKVLSTVYKLVQSNTYATKRDIYYNDTQLFGSQRTVDSVVDDISCMLKIPRRSLHVLATSKGLISGDLCYQEEDGTKMNCKSSLTAVSVSSNVYGIKNIVSSAKFILIVEKDATFQRLLDDEFGSKTSPCIMITGKGVPDINSRLMVRKLWDTLHIPILALVDADPHGIEIMSIYKYGSVSMSFEAQSLTVPSVMWLGLLPSDIERLRVPKDALVPFSKKDESKLSSLLKRPYVSLQPAWEKEMELLQKWKQKAEIQCLTSIAADFLTRVYLPNKLRYGGWI
ncbi:meiotic recombination protein SPO11 isoform X3 [Paramormyrops kingsleyae]|uniref:meiotic recombination protein SPO11 isoform X3 n=1 Tax=Paramormyrops kingsleyae TaxID=1676925 RepID=UPI003B96EF99